MLFNWLFVDDFCQKKIQFILNGVSQISRQAYGCVMFGQQCSETPVDVEYLIFLNHNYRVFVQVKLTSLKTNWSTYFEVISTKKIISRKPISSLGWNSLWEWMIFSVFQDTALEYGWSRFIFPTISSPYIFMAVYMQYKVECPIAFETLFQQFWCTGRRQWSHKANFWWWLEISLWHHWLLPKGISSVDGCKVWVHQLLFIWVCDRAGAAVQPKSLHYFRGSRCYWLNEIRLNGKNR